MVGGRIIAHLDMDAFYAAIEERDNPQFAGKPIVVGADPKEGTGRGVVSTANYKAREYGIKSAMPISQAYRLAPEAIFLPPDIHKYQRVSEEILEILKSKISLVEKASTDEFYLDLSHIGSYEDATDFMEEMKEKIGTEEKLTCSVGIGSNKLVAKIASDKNKPNGLTVVGSNEVLSFLAPLNVREIPGIGPKTAQKFYEKGIKTIGGLRKLGRGELIGLIGSFGETLFDLARGKDERPVGEAQPVKSVGKQVTFEKDTDDPKFIADTLLGLVSEVWRSVEESAKGSDPKFPPDKGRPEMRNWVRPYLKRTVTVTIRYAGFETHTKSKTLREGLQNRRQFRRVALKLLIPFLDQKRKVRLVGVRLS